MNIRELQTAQLPWQVNTFQHAVLHAAKAAGALAGRVDDYDHHVANGVLVPEAAYADAAKYIADLIIIALKLAKEFPGQEFDLQDLVIARMREKGALAK